ncbi:MAG: ATP-binding protein [Actinomycetota bacterium]|nr:GAF domain-containing protein [Actinomycetota bacterium]
MTPDTALLKPYRLRTVKIAVQSTGLALVALAIYPLLPGHGALVARPYILLMVVATIGAASFNFLPWNKILDNKRGMWVFYGWSFLDITLITLLVLVSRGGSSELFLLYALTTIFLAVSYPPWGQAALLAVTFVMYALVSQVGDAPLNIASLFFRLTTLGITALMGKFLSSELMGQMAAYSEARDESMKRAGLLEAVARSGKSTNSLDPEEVMGAVVAAATELGFEAVEICVFDEGAGIYRIEHSFGLPENYLAAPHRLDEGMIAKVRQIKQTFVVNDYVDFEDGLISMRELGFRAVVASPIWSGTRMVAVLAAGTRARRSVTKEDIESFELLSGQASAAFENAKRFEHERQAVQRLEELDRLKQDFMATISHELKTPLTVIKGMTQTLERRWESLDPNLRQEFLRKVNDNTDTLERTITELLDFSRLQSGELRAEMQQIPVAGLITSAVEKLSNKLADKHVDTMSQRGICVAGDRRLLQRAIEELVSNAAKHTQPGAHISISAIARGDEAVFEVADDGRGIPESELSALTREFFRGGDVDTRSTRGTGMGLAMVNAILRLHSSRLDISNRQPQGASFTFSLPMAVYDMIPEAEQVPAVTVEPGL